MAPAGALPALPLLLALLQVLLPGPGDTQTWVTPGEAILPRGGSVLVNCSSSCKETARLGLETPLTKTENKSGHNWQVFELSDVQTDSRPLCFSNCGKNQSSASISITVYWFPERVELAPLSTWEPVGKNLTLRCQIWGGAPRAQLTLVLLRGEEELSRQPAVGEPAEVIATVLAGRGDYGANFTCRTELDLRPQGLGLFQNTSAPWQLRTFDLPTTSPQLDTPSILEVGALQRVVCSMDGLFPALEAQVHLALGDQRLNSTVTYNKDSLSATAVVEGTVRQEGDRQLVCAIMLGNEHRESRRTLTIYSFPAPNLTLIEQEVSEGTQVVVVCEAYAGNVVMLTGAPAGLQAPRAEFLMNATAEDNGRRFSCSAALEVDGQVLYKNETQELSVLYGPRLDERDCLGNWTWEAGTQQKLVCEAWGNPVPRLTCVRENDGVPLPIGYLTPVREHEGTYCCEAVSSRGKVTRKVFLKVLERPRSVILEPPILVGHKYILRCHVTHVFPVGFLVVSLRRSGRIIYFESLERYRDLDLANVTLTYVLRTGPRDLWQPVTCHARLNLDGLVVRSSSAPVILTAFVWNPVSKALASTSIAALVGILLAMGVAYLRKYLAVQSQA